MSKAKKSMHKPAMNAATAESWLIVSGFEDEQKQFHKAMVNGTTACAQFKSGEYGQVEVVKLKRQPKLRITAAADTVFKATVYVSFDKQGWGLSVMPSTNTYPIEYAHALQIALHVAAVIIEYAKAGAEDFGMHLLDATDSLVMMESPEYE